MYINPFFAGVLVTLVAELLLFLGWAILRKEDKDDR